MASKLPIVNYAGAYKELQTGDTCGFALVFGSSGAVNTYLCCNGAGSASASDYSLTASAGTGTFVVPKSGTTGNLAVQITSSGSAVNATITLRKNGADQAVTATLTNTTGYAADATHTFSVSPGDLITAHWVVNSGSYFGSISLSFTVS